MDYREIFRKKHTLLPVIHAESAGQALRNARIAAENGADGIFLINHRIPASGLQACYGEIRRALLGTRLWIGMNFLDLERTRAHDALPADAGGLWCDDAGYREGAADPARGAREFQQFRRTLPMKSEIYFASVAFKHQPDVEFPAEAAKAMIPYCDVIATSGLCTGDPPPIGKIRDMKAAIGNRPLAIASGITPENVRSYLPHADCFMVATGISFSHTELDPAKVRAFADAIKP